MRIINRSIPCCRSQPWGDSGEVTTEHHLKSQNWTIVGHSLEKIWAGSCI